VPADHSGGKSFRAKIEGVPKGELYCAALQSAEVWDEIVTNHGAINGQRVGALGTFAEAISCVRSGLPSRSGPATGDPVTVF